jgi:tetratricopeptide (TPR) repeat protein
MKSKSIHINSKPNWLFLGVIGLIFPVVFYHLFSAGFIAWDDPEYVLNNKDVHQFSVKNFFTHFYIGNYHPLTMMSYALDWKLFGKQAAGYHIENILWHFFNTVLVFFLGKKLQLKSMQAFLLAVVFAFHPLQIESLAWVAERKNVLYAFFFLLSLGFYISYKNKGNYIYLAAVYFCFILSLLSKPSAVVLPLVLILMDVFLYKEKLKQFYKRHIVFILLSLILGIVTVFGQDEAKFLMNTHHYPLVNKIGIFGYGFFHYVSKFLIPVNLSAFYSYPKSLTAVTLIGFFALVLFIVLLYVLVRKKQYSVVFGLLFFLVNIILVLQILPFGDAIAADRYMYLPIIGLTLAGIYLFEKFNLNLVIIATVTVILCALSFTRAVLWKDSLTLFLNVLKTNPTSFIAINSLGVEYMERNDFEKSYQYLNQVVKLYPDYYKGYYNRGLLNGKTQKYNDALFDFKKAIEYKNYYKAYAGRAAVYYSLKDFPKAIDDAEAALKIDPNNLKAHYVLATCYDDLNQLDKAIAYYNIVITLNSENPLYHLRRAIVYGKLKNYTACLQDLEVCIALDKNYAEAYYWRGVVRVNMQQNPCGDLKKAVELGFMAAQQSLATYCR